MSQRFKMMPITMPAKAIINPINIGIIQRDPVNCPITSEMREVWLLTSEPSLSMLTIK
jgi:hypothetical protein